jgi:hypothetical protein
MTYKFKDKENIKVEWPDGSQTTEEIKIVFYIKEEWGNGEYHPHAFKKEIPSIYKKINGLEIIITDFSELKISR